MQGNNKEIERKWLIKNFPEDLKLLCEGNVQQAYLSMNPEVRIRRKAIKGSPVAHFITIKSDGDLVRDEVEVKISKAQYETLLQMISGDPIVKEYKVYETVNGNQVECSRVDPDTDNEFMYAEIEFKDQNNAEDFAGLDFFEKEVTKVPDYKMKNYWTRTRFSYSTEKAEDSNKEQVDSKCEDCDHSDGCKMLNHALSCMGPFGTYLKSLIDSGKMKVYYAGNIANPSSISDNEDEDHVETEAQENEANDEPMTPEEMSETLAFTAVNVGQIHEHLDGFGFNERQLSEIEGIIHSEAEALYNALAQRTSPYRWIGNPEGLVEAKVGKIKTGMSKKKVKKLIRKKLKKFLGSKRLRKLIRKISKDESVKTRRSIRSDMYNLSSRISTEISKSETRSANLIRKQFQENSCSCDGCGITDGELPKHEHGNEPCGGSK